VPRTISGTGIGGTTAAAPGDRGMSDELQLQPAPKQPTATPTKMKSSPNNQSNPHHDFSTYQLSSSQLEVRYFDDTNAAKFQN